MSFDKRGRSDRQLFPQKRVPIFLNHWKRGRLPALDSSRRRGAGMTARGSSLGGQRTQLREGDLRFDDAKCHQQFLAP